MAWLADHGPHRQLVVYDALRPHRVQEALWRQLQDTPLRHYLADPARGSIHSFGMAIDVGLYLRGSGEVDMGTGFDDMSELSHPDLEEMHLAQGRLLFEQVSNRRLLRQAMSAGGFNGVSHEWWHFDLHDRDEVRRTYQRVD